MSVLLALIWFSVIQPSSQAQDLGFRFIDGQCLNKKGDPGLNPDFVGQCGSHVSANLSGTDFSGTDISGSVFIYADLTGALLKESLALKVQFSHADLTGADLSKGAFKGTSFSHAKLDGTNLDFADLQKASLRWASLKNVKTAGTVFDQATYTETTRLPFSTEQAAADGMIFVEKQGTVLWNDTSFVYRPSSLSLHLFFSQKPDYKMIDFSNGLPFIDVLSRSSLLILPLIDNYFNEKLDDTSRKSLTEFVSSGGTFVIAAPYTYAFNEINRIFSLGMDYAAADNISEGSVSKSKEFAKGTLFAEAPDSIPLLEGVVGTAISFLPMGSKTIYRSKNVSLLTIVPFGDGQIILVGWDFYNASANGANQKPWFQILNLIAEDQL